MITLTDQLIEDLQEAFETRDDDFKFTTVKDTYEVLPEEQYPLVTVEEIENSEVVSRSTTKGERTTNLAYQITAYSRDTQNYTAKQSVRKMFSIIDETLSLPNYNMRRESTTPIIPVIDDNTIMYGSTRRSCVYDYDTNYIYKN